MLTRKEYSVASGRVNPRSNARMIVVPDREALKVARYHIGLRTDLFFEQFSREWHPMITESNECLGTLYRCVVRVIRDQAVQQRAI